MTDSVKSLLAAAKRSISEEHEENCLSDAIFSNVCPFCVGYRASALDAAVKAVEAQED